MYNLNVGFTNAQLEILYATGTNVIVAKPSATVQIPPTIFSPSDNQSIGCANEKGKTDGVSEWLQPSGGGSPNVAWQVFKPMQANTLSWEELYGIYASTVDFRNGARLIQLSSTGPAEKSKLYPLLDRGVITGPFQGGSPHSFSLLNLYSHQRYMTVGLYQDANVNGTEIDGNAVSAAPVLFRGTAVMIPFTTVYIWLVSSVVSNSITMATSPMTQLKFGDGVDTISVAYDSASGTFLPASSALNDADSSLVSALNPPPLL